MSENNSVQKVGVASKEELVSLESSIWKEITISERLKIPHQKPDIEQLTKVIVEAKIINQRLIETPTAPAPNPEGKLITGKKMIIEGLLKEKIIYVAECSEQSLHAAHFKVPFSVFLVAPANAESEEEFEVKVFIEDIFIKVLSPREVFKNTVVFFSLEEVT